MIEAVKIVVRRAGRSILAGASLSVAGGQIATIEGESGSGKTTLLRVLATLTEPDQGEVRLDGQDARALSPMSYRTKVAYVLQQSPMLEGTVERNLGVGPALRGVTLSSTELDALLDRVHLPVRFRSARARDLSGGERQRLALARALANQPEVLLLDEPTAALDPATATRVLDTVRSLAGSGLAIVVVTHATEHARVLGGDHYRCSAGTIAAA